MKLIIIKSNLRDALSIVDHSTGDHQNLPILKNVWIDASGNTIALTTTNLELAVTSFVSGKIIEQGVTTTPLAPFFGIISNLQTERINLEEKNTKLEIKTDNYNASIQSIPAEDFPIIPKIKNESHYIEFRGDLLHDALAQVVPSTQVSELRPELSSVLFYFSLDHIKIAATDSFRLSEKTITKTQIKTNHTEAFKILIPLRTAQELLRVIRPTETVKMHHDANQVLFKTERFRMVSRLLEGAFPDYEYLIPKKFDAEVVVAREEFLQALKLVGVFSARVSEVKLKTPEHKKNIEIFSVDQGLGENQYLLPGKVAGSVREIGFNWRYLSDGLKAVSGESVFVGLNDDNKPALLKSSTDASYFYILMPILRV